MVTSTRGVAPTINVMVVAQTPSAAPPAANGPPSRRAKPQAPKPHPSANAPLRSAGPAVLPAARSGK